MVKDREILSTEEQLGLSKEQIQQLKDKSLSKAGRIEVAVLLLNETYTFKEAGAVRYRENGEGINQTGSKIKQEPCNFYSA